jgi:hypothetical protein
MITTTAASSTPPIITGMCQSPAVFVEGGGVVDAGKGDVVRGANSVSKGSSVGFRVVDVDRWGRFLPRRRHLQLMATLLVFTDPTHSTMGRVHLIIYVYNNT